jgi:putative phosphoesterase
MPTVRQEAVTVKSGKLGVIADTHGLLRKEALAALEQSEVIIHGGDIGKPEVLEALATLAPVLAVRGNNDRGSWAKNLPDILNLRINGVGIRVIHNVQELAEDLTGECRVVISGHSHKPGAVSREGILFLNPGSAGPRRFRLPVTVARLGLGHGRVRARIIELALDAL